MDTLVVINNYTIPIDHLFHQKIRPMKTLITFLIILLSGSVFSQEIARKKDKEVSIVLKEGTLYGSLLVPKGKEAKPIIVLIPGSGPTDRNCNSLMGLTSNSFMMLAEELYKKGLPTLRIDKRASGKSLPTFRSSLDTIMFDDFVNDAVRWVEFLRKDKRFSKVVLAGHSQGSLVAILVAKKCKVDGVISLAGAGRPIDQILYDQLSPSFSYPENSDTLRIFLDSLYQGSYFDQAPAQLKNTLPKALQPFLTNWFSYDPSDAISDLNIPVAIFQGRTDLQVAENEAVILRSAYETAYFKIFENMNHVLKDASIDPIENYKMYNAPNEPITKGLSDEMFNFLIVSNLL